MKRTIFFMVNLQRRETGKPTLKSTEEDHTTILDMNNPMSRKHNRMSMQEEAKRPQVKTVRGRDETRSQEPKAEAFSGIQ